MVAGLGDPVVTVALSDRVDAANAPRPSNESERLVFRQLYETLIRTDCTRRVLPGLAASWRLDGDGRTWIVTLREEARFSDGTPVTAAHVRASWTTNGIDGELRRQVNRLIESVVIVDDRSLAITLRNHLPEVPAVLAHPDLAVAKPVAGSPWPLGSRSMRASLNNETAPAAAEAVITLARDDLSAIRYLVASGDPRDLLDAGVDLLLTRDPAALDYAATLPLFQSLPLPWQRVHVLLVPGRPRTSPSLPEGTRQALADDAIRGEARGAQDPFWWEMPTNCEFNPVSSRNAPSPAPRIVYDANDAAARDLAERFVGLARASDAAANAFLEVLFPGRPRRQFQRATPLSGEALARARRLGNDAGYVVSLDSRPLEPCGDAQALMDTAPWLDPRAIVALVETRLRAIVRRGRTGVSAEWDGGLIIAGPNRK